jgi:hypothetical protein
MALTAIYKSSDLESEFFLLESIAMLSDITMDVTWLLHNTPESNRQSAEWTERDEPNPKRGNTQRSAGISITRCAWYYILQKGPDHQQRVSHGVIGVFK